MHLTHLLLSATLLVLNKKDSTLTMLEPDSGRVVGIIPTGEAPHELVVSGDGRYAYVANYGASTPGSSISIIDLTKRTEKRVDISPFRRPHGIAFGRDGKVYFTVEENRIVARLDPASGKVDAQFRTDQTATHMVLFTKDGSRMITANMGSGTVSLLKPGSQPVHIRTGRGPEGMDVSPDGRELWVANSHGGSITVIDLSANTVTTTLNIGTRRSNRLKFSPDGKLVLVSDLEGGKLVAVDVAGRKVVKRIGMGRMPEGILVPPGGNKAYIAVTGTNRIAVFDFQKLTITREMPSGGRAPDSMAWIR